MFTSFKESFMSSFCKTRILYRISKNAQVLAQIWHKKSHDPSEKLPIVVLRPTSLHELT